MINFVLFQDKDAKIFNALIPHNNTMCSSSELCFRVKYGGLVKKVFDTFRKQTKEYKVSSTQSFVACLSRSPGSTIE